MTVSAHSKSIRKQRSIATTDDEWNAIKMRADHLGISISRLITEKVLESPVSDDESSSPTIHDLLAAHQEILREVLILTTLTKDNMDSRDDGERFDTIAKKIDARLNSI